MSEEDFFQTLVQLCYEANQTTLTPEAFLQKAHFIITTELKQKQREFNKLYNPHINCSLDMCYGDSKVPLGEYFNSLDTGYD